MAIVRVEKNKNYTCMSNYHLRDTRLSNKAVGLMSKMLSLPDNWDYSIQGLTAICKDGKDSIISQLKELEATGYLIRQKSKNDKGQFKKIEYTLYEKPVTENPNAEKPNSGNPTQLNTNKLSTKELNKEVVEEKTTTTISSIDQDVLRCYQDNIQMITKPIELEKLADDIERYGADKCIEAIKRAVIRNKRSLGYVESILHNWEVNGYDTGEGKKEIRRNQPRYTSDIMAEEMAELEAYARGEM